MADIEMESTVTDPQHANGETKFEAMDDSELGKLTAEDNVFLFLLINF